MQVPSKKIKKKKLRKLKNKHMSKLANLSECLSDILKSYEESDSELSQSNSSRSISSYMNDSLTSVSDLDNSKVQDERNYNGEITISEQFLKPITDRNHNIIMVKPKTLKNSDKTNQKYANCVDSSTCKSLVG